MIIIYSIAISLLLGSDSSRTKYKSDFFKDLDLKLNYNPSEILPKEPADKYANFNKSKSTLYIDSIKNIAKNYIPTPPNSSDIIIMETNKPTNIAKNKRISSFFLSLIDRNGFMYCSKENMIDFMIKRF